MKIKKFLFIQNMFIIIILGFISNLGVMINNNSKMPVHVYYDGEINFSEDENYISFVNPKEVKYFYLSDIFRIETKKFRTIFSFGDLLFFLGICGLIYISSSEFIRKGVEKINHGIIRITKR